MRSFNGPRRTKLVFRRGFQRLRFRHKIPRTQIAIPAHHIGMNALDRRFIQHAMRRTIAAADTLIRVKLPDVFVLASQGQQRSGRGPQRRQSPGPKSLFKELPPMQIVRICIFHCLSVKTVSQARVARSSHIPSAAEGSAWPCCPRILSGFLFLYKLLHRLRPRQRTSVQRPAIPTAQKPMRIDTGFLRWFPAQKLYRNRGDHPRHGPTKSRRKALSPCCHFVFVHFHISNLRMNYFHFFSNILTTFRSVSST